MFEIKKTDNIEMSFLSVEQFDALKAAQEKIMKWRDVPTGIIYKIEKKEYKNTEKGKATVLTLSDRDGKQLIVWATNILRDDLKKRKGTCYIKPLEKKESTKNPGQFYYNYELVEMPVEKVHA